MSGGGGAGADGRGTGTGGSGPTAGQGVAVAPGIEFPDTADGRTHVAGAVIADGRGRVFAQRRSATRKVFPHCWDIVGGHVEQGETMLEGLAREVEEETGWRLVGVLAELYRLDWDPGDGVTRHEVDYLVRVEGDLSAPRLEPDKHTEHLWVDDSLVHRLRDERDPGDYFITDIVQRGLDSARSADG
ncbi:NUDIX domain-containing protein [Streptomonospora nanhaiensis]|uniref:NUDIX domain-containing protein n=1 Tax=Streptomonospora nanhaiensis TaxID=1323731 RepID=A0ABY6YKI1_9ACTN|nr:NUDIX domain-containing protein [Streptomonospora nanhaiensis]WAE72839.1 NUDIX domain-containing protein [Streptomonospora nanhaiensis]